MTRASLLDLAARVEAAEHGLTAAIARAVGWRTYPVGWWRAPDGTSHAEPPAYLTSLDAAASLVPDHWCWEVHRWGLCHISPQPQHPRWKGGGVRSQKACVRDKPALALTAAALRAMAEEAPHE